MLAGLANVVLFVMLLLFVVAARLLIVVWRSEPGAAGASLLVAAWLGAAELPLLGLVAVLR